MQRLCAGNGKRNSGTWEENFGTLQLCVNQWQQVLDRSPLLAAAKGFYLYSSRDPFTDPEGNSGVRWCGLVWNWCEFDHLPISVDTLPDRVIVLVQLTSAVARHPGVEILALRLR